MLLDGGRSIKYGFILAVTVNSMRHLCAHSQHQNDIDSNTPSLVLPFLFRLRSIAPQAPPQTNHLAGSTSTTVSTRPLVLTLTSTGTAAHQILRASLAITVVLTRINRSKLHAWCH